MDTADHEVTEVRQVPGLAGGPGRDAGEPAAPLGPGSVLATYRLVAPSGAGLSSEVFEAESLVSRKRCAVKVFRPALDLGPVEFGRYVHEARTVASIGHPGIADLFQSGRADGRYFSVMALEAGTDLRSFVRRNAPLPRRAHLPILRGICEALAPVHALGLCHGRLHGGQVVIRVAEQSVSATLLDFGTHHLLPGVKETTGLKRGAEDAVYASPEQAKGQPADARSDVYSLCVMLYEMLTGRVPFLGATFAQTLEQHISEAPVPPGTIVKVPPEIDEVVLRGLEKDPRKRIPSVEALLAALDPRGATAAHPGAGAITGRHQALAPSPSKEYVLTPLLGDRAGLEEAAPALAAAPPGRHLDDAPEEAPVRRWLLWMLLVVAIAVAGGGAFLLFGGQAKKGTARPPAKKPTPAAGAGARAATPPTRPAPRLPLARAAKTATAGVPAARPPAPAAAIAAVKPAPVTGPAAGALQLRGLQINRGSGSLAVETGNPAARVFVDGHVRGEGERVTIRDLPVGKHRIQIEVNGRRLPHRDVEIGKDRLLDIAF